LQTEQTLDPQNWEEIRVLGHRMIDDMLDHIKTSGQRPAWTRPSEDAKQSLLQPVPVSPQAAEEVYEEFLSNVLPYGNTNIHPRFWAWVQGSGTPLGMLADMLASGMNSNVSIGDHIAMYVEKQVIEWSKQMMGFPRNSSGILTSGASIANITALIVARNHFNASIRTKGLQAVNGQLIVYGSSETHNCVAKAIEVIGIGSENFRKIPVDSAYRVDISALKKAIEQDKRAGLIPFCIIGNAGTVNTGSIDPLDELAAIAKEYKLWYHVDGAFGAIPKLLPEFDVQLKGIELADSLSFDFHKWLYVNYEVGCVLIRDVDIHRNAFATSVNYLTQHERGLSAGPESLMNFGMELSRGFKALKVWMSIKEHGLEKYKTLIRQNLQQAQYLAELIKESNDLELLADVPLNIVCYRFNPGNTDNETINELNKKILMQLHEEGIAAPSYTLLNGRYAIRVANTNHRSKKEDFDALVEETSRIGRELSSNQESALSLQV
jgi:glutamate/tyrosine decarboxylase-like PLP-dependent enzyme